jgi:hypothetical protein
VTISVPKDYWKRLGNSAWQAFIGSLPVAALASAVLNGNFSAAEAVLLAAVGAAAAAIVTALKNFAFNPVASGLVGIAERVIATFIAAAAGAIPLQVLASAFAHRDVPALQSALSLIQHLGGPKAQPATILHPFLFRGPDGTNVVASTMEDFIALCKGVSDATLEQHLQNHDFSRWLETSVNNGDLAKRVSDIESSSEPLTARRARLVDEISSFYGLTPQPAQ